MMPIIGQFAGGMDFAELKYMLSPEIKDAAGEITSPGNAIRFGAWINTIINLIIVGLVLFVMSKAYTKTKKKEAAAPPAGPSDNALLMEIRDALKK